MSVQSGDQLLHYRLIEKIGEGGMGVVWRALDTDLDREVAIKLLPAAFAADAERVARFRREAKLLASLNHPHIAQMYGLHTHEGQTFLAMEYVAGENLLQRLARGPIPPDEALPLALQLTLALDTAHGQGIVHRDLKPANIVLGEDGALKVLDFGLAKATFAETSPGSDPSHSPTVTSAGTMAGVILGTAAYMSPEQARGRTTDARCDLWAFGVVLMEMLTARQVFAGETVSDIIAAVIKSEPNWDSLPDETPRPIRRLLRRCLRKDPAKRIHHADAARLELEDALAAPDPVEIAGKDAARSRPRFTGLMPWAIAVLAVAVALVFGMRGRTGPDAPADPVAYRFELPWTGGGRTPAISPDGRRFAYVHRDENTRAGTIRVRTFDQGESESLTITGTEVDDSDLYWTPDGKSLLFFSEDSLGRVAVDGGAPQILCKLPSGGQHLGVAADGTILVEVMWNAKEAGWYRLRPGARELEPYERPFEPVPGQTANWPYFHGDGIHLVYTNLVDGERQAFLARFDETDATPLFPTDTLVIPVEDWYVYGLRGRLVARPFDPSTRMPTGDPRVLAERVAVFTPAGHISLSASRKGTLIYSGDERRSELVWFDQDGNELESFLEDPEIRWAEISPDGRRVVVSIGDHRTGTTDLWTHDLERGIVTRLTDTPFAEFQAVWSPDGRRLGYSADPQGPPNLYLIDSAGGSPTELTSPEQRASYVTGWTPDGEGVVFTRADSETDFDIWFLDAAGGDPRPLVRTPAREMWGRISPNGRWLAYAAVRSDRSNVWLHRLGGDQPDVQVTVEGGWEEQWQGDDRLTFHTYGQRVMTVKLGFEGDRVDVGEPEVLVDLGARTGEPQDLDAHDVHPDGRILILRQFGDPQERRASVLVGW